jgi:hypothetical protein
LKTFIEFCTDNKKELPVISEKTTRSGISHWAYPDGYIRSHYSAGYFTPIAADALQKLGPKADEKEVDHGQMTYQHHERIKRQEKK